MVVWFNLAVSYTPHSCLLNPLASLFLYSHSRWEMEKLTENLFFPSSLPGSRRRPHHIGPHNPRRTNSSYRQRTSPLHQQLPPPRLNRITRHNLHRGNPEVNLRENTIHAQILSPLNFSISGLNIYFLFIFTHRSYLFKPEVWKNCKVQL